MGTVTEYQNEFEMLIKQVTIHESLLKSFYISGLKLALQRLLFRSLLQSPYHRGSFENENNQAIDANVGNQEEPKVKDKQEVKKANDQEIENIHDEEGTNVKDQAVDANAGNQEESKVKDKQEVKKANDQEIENIHDEEGMNVKDQQVSEADDDTNIDDFGCSLPHHKEADLTVEEVVHENIKSDLEEDENEQGKKKKNKGVITFFEIGANKDSNPNAVFNDVGGVRYSKADMGAC
ncbi:hypothetical protein Tco_0167582 [Tanacetum coccineum]